MAATKVIIDTDAGTDDALAIFMALEAHRQGCLQILAITTVHGNTTVKNVNNNVLRILRLSNLLDIPVYSGADRSLVHRFIFSKHPFHGLDGFGDADLPPEPAASTLLQPQHAVWAMHDLVVQHSGEVVMVALGPLTNLVLAMRIDPTFTSHLAGLYIMGGNTTGIGNITPYAEFNFHCDADAAFIVLEKAGIPIHLTPWEICRKGGSFPYSFRHEVGKTKTAVADLMNKIEANAMKQNILENWVTCDQLAMAWLIDNVKNEMLKTEASKRNGVDPENFLNKQGKPLATVTKTCYAVVNTMIEMKDGRVVIPSKRGQVTVDYEDRLGRQHNVVLLEGVEKSVYEKYIQMAFGADV